MRRYTVRQLTDEISALLAGRYPAVEVEGEITQVTTPGSGHAYFTLRDGDVVLGCVAWRDTWRALKHRPEAGTRVVARGKLGVYGGKGAYQLYVNDLSPAGEGAFAAELARRRARLEAEGLFDPRRKRTLPRYPRVIGVATSLTGAALQDFLKVSGQRWPACRVLVAGCLVQGPQAAGSVVMAVDRLLEDGRAELVVVTRGGGSKEDLLAFQDEALARYLAHCPIPVVSAVGHQVDTTLCDLVADVIAPTPTAAAVVVLPDGPALVQRVDEASVALASTFARVLRQRRREVDVARARLRHPSERLALVRRRASDLEARLRARMQARLPEQRRRVTVAAARLGPQVLGLGLRRERLRRLEERLAAVLRVHVERRTQRLARAEAQVRALSPQAVLERGYAVLVGASGVIARVGDAAAGDHLIARLADGQLAVRVESSAEVSEGGGVGGPG